MNNVYPDSRASDRREPPAMGIVEHLRHGAVFEPITRKAAGDKDEKPRHYREEIRGIKAVRKYPQREQHIDIKYFFGEYPCETSEAYITVVRVPGKRGDKREYQKPDERGYLFERVLKKPVKHHRNAQKMQYAEPDHARREQRHYKRYHHAENKALCAAPHVVVRISAHYSRNTDERPREDVADNIEPAVEKDRYIEPEHTFKLKQFVVDHHTYYCEPTYLVEHINSAALSYGYVLLCFHFFHPIFLNFHFLCHILYHTFQKNTTPLLKSFANCGRI